MALTTAKCAPWSSQTLLAAAASTAPGSLGAASACGEPLQQQNLCAQPARSISTQLQCAAPPGSGPTTRQQRRRSSVMCRPSGALQGLQLRARLQSGLSTCVPSLFRILVSKFLGMEKDAPSLQGQSGERQGPCLEECPKEVAVAQTGARAEPLKPVKESK